MGEVKPRPSPEVVTTPLDAPGLDTQWLNDMSRKRARARYEKGMVEGYTPGKPGKPAPPAAPSTPEGASGFPDRHPVMTAGMAGAGIGLAAGVLSYLISKKKDKSLWKRMLWGAGIGAGAGAGAGYVYDLGDIEKLDPLSQRLLSEKQHALTLPKSRWRELYLENVADEGAREYYQQNVDDPNHPVNVLYRQLEQHAKEPELAYERVLGMGEELPRTRLPASERGEGLSYTGGDPGLSVQDLKDLGFQQVVIGAPEPGQSEFLTWRHPEHGIHVHRHPKSWFFHIDEMTSTPMLQQNLAKAGKSFTARNVLAALLHGAPHAIIEGVPSWMHYIGKSLVDAPSLTQMAEAEAGERSYQRGTDYHRPGVIAGRMGLAAGVPLLGYYGYKRLTEQEEEEEKKKKRRPARRAPRRRPRLAPA